MYAVVVANSGDLGHGMRYAPDAKLDDGKLDLCILRRFTLADVLRLAVRTLLGGLREDRALEFRQARKIEIDAHPPLEIQIDGEIQGDLHGANVVIGETARITGSIVAEEIIVRGTVMGSVRGKRVVLQSTSRVEGDIFHNQLAIEQGAFFEGKSRRMDDPTAGVERPEIPGPASAAN